MYASRKKQKITEVSFLNKETKLDKWLNRKFWWQYCIINYLF